MRSATSNTWFGSVGELGNRFEQQILVVVAEICQGGNCLESDARDMTLSVEVEGHVRCLDVAVPGVSKHPNVPAKILPPCGYPVAL